MNKKIMKSQWFDRFTHVFVTKHFNTLPSVVTHLVIGSYVMNFDRNKIPTTVTHLTFGMNFNQPVTYLPSSITHLNFGKNFNGRDFFIPSSVTHLKFGKRFNRSLERQIPSSVIQLSFGKDIEYFNNKHIPMSVNKIIYRGTHIATHVLYYARFIINNPECSIYFPARKLNIDLGFWYPKCFMDDMRINYEILSNENRYGLLPQDMTEMRRYIIN